jgi:salicylate 5-hydroxylase small subunit
MNGASRSLLPARPPIVPTDLRAEIADLYADYAACLDEARFADWPGFFTEVCTYKVVPRENYDRSLPLSTIWAESRGMLEDRVVGITQTMMYAPHYWRHLISLPRIREVDGDVVRVEANYAIVKTIPDEMSELFQAGRYLDEIVRDDGRLRFREKLCVFDSVLIGNSLIYPV